MLPAPDTPVPLPPSFGFQWHITDRCPGRCRHCYQDRFDTSREQDLPALMQIAKLIFETLPVPISVNVTGGEPLLYPKLFELLDYLGGFPHLEELNLITGAIPITATHLARLRTLPRFDYVKVSLEAADEALNDSLRGVGHFAMTSTNVSRLRSEGLPVVLMTTIGRHNYNHIAALCELAWRWGVQGLILERFVPIGKGAFLREQALEPEQWCDVRMAVCKVCAPELDPEELCGYQAFWIDIDSDRTMGLRAAPCNLQPGSMALMPDGTVYPCRRLPHALGRLPDNSMESILHSLSAFASLHAPSTINAQTGSLECDGMCAALRLALRRNNATDT